MLEVSIIKCLSDNFSYLIRDTKTKLVGVVDPSEFNPVDLEISRKYKKLDFILNTHHHSDHVGGNLDLKKKYNSKIVCSSYEKNKIPGSEISMSDKEEFIFGETTFKIMHVPGHTAGHIIFYTEKDNLVFTGDTLFSMGCGRVFEGTLEQMHNSLGKIKKLSRNTLIYCGHEYTKNNAKFCLKNDNQNTKLKKRFDTVEELLKKNLPTIPITLAEELETNIFLRCDNKKIKSNLKMEKNSEFEVFSKLRKLKDQF